MKHEAGTLAMLCFYGEVARATSAVSDEARFAESDLRAHHDVSVSGGKPTMQFRFSRLADEWKRATCFHSSLREITSHPAYLRIIALGPDVTPLILHRMEQDPDHWSAALWALTGVNPICDQSRGDLRAVAADWLLWARSEELV